MCGLFGIATVAGARPSLGDRQVEHLRDLLRHRGPDDAGLWRGGKISTGAENVVLAHRRLSVIDPGPAGHQPMVFGEANDGNERFSLVYNGELYNDAEMRKALADAGVATRTDCDTETVLLSLASFGVRALEQFRGMFALALYDRQSNKLLLARDPLGVKPLYFAIGADSNGREEIVFASEIAPILGVPTIEKRPNLSMISAYLTTIRTVIGSTTLFEGVYAVRPGEFVEVDLNGERISATLHRYWSGPEEIDEPISMEVASQWFAGTMTESVRRHLRSDVPICALLSGGIDSTVIATIARDQVQELRTYCAGAQRETDEPDADLDFARRTADWLGSRHEQAIISRELFRVRWPEMVQRLGVPLSTPNEVAIYTVADRLRADGCVVTLSGEGADELLGGYQLPMTSALRYTQGAGTEGLSGAGKFELESNAWVHPSMKATLLRPEIWDALRQDRALFSVYDQEMNEAAAEAGGYGLKAHLRLHRRINLTGLLQRLDTATMLASVEGRTPFADAIVARLSESLPMDLKFREFEGAFQTKRVLRESFATAIPQEVLEREKASFPLPFQSWVGDQADRLRESAFARELFTDAAIALVGAEASKHWNLSWPMINLAIWGERWFD
jgi:asparagine synthase (glutamine-hydrolysing)